MEVASKDKTKDKEALNAQVKKNYSAQDATYFVEAGASKESILKADKEGKKLIFDIVDFPEVSNVTLGNLSRENRIAYQEDARIAKRASDRVSGGLSPYTDIRDKLISQDPLHVDNANGNSGKVTDGAKGMHYLAADPRHTGRMERAGYKFVKPGEVSVINGIDKGSKVVLMGDNGNVDNVIMKVDKDDYDKHVAIQAKKSQARLGENLESTKEKMGKYGSKVTLYDKSDFSTIRPQKG